MTSSKLLLVVLLAGASAFAADLHPFEAVEPHMGTLFRIKLYAANQERASAAFAAAFARVAELDRTLSDYHADSELSRATATWGRPVQVSDDLFQVVRAAQALASDSDGAFDITLGPVTHLWRQARRNGSVPEVACIRAAEERSGYRKLHVDPERHTVTVDGPGMQLDAGGIAKGYAADEALAVLRHLGIGSALVAASGDLAFGDAPPGETGWSIGVDSFDQAGASFTRVLHLQRSAVSTSGDSQQALASGALRYSHVLDPKTGMGLTNRLAVTVVAPTGMEADSMTKVLSVWGPDKGLAFLEKRPGTAALIVDKATGRTFERGL